MLSPVPPCCVCLLRAVLLLLCAFPVPVMAEVFLPDGTTVPRNSNNGEKQLDQLFSERGEAVNWIADGTTEPDTFSPRCDLTATLLMHEAGSSIAVGWYNSDPAATVAPAASEIFEIVPSDAPLDTTFDAAAIRSDPRYTGGDIGFALMRSPAHFTESRFNPECQAGGFLGFSPCASTAPWILAVTYRSTLLPNAYYVAFEDGNTSSTNFGNDGDYNDYVFLFEGLSCAGAGEPCSVDGAFGACVEGVLDCDALGQLTCQPLVEPSAEQCDGFDNDCDGETDEGDDLCEVGQVCDQGQCVDSCLNFEFQCLVAPFTECDRDRGLCVDPACAGVSCAEGEICVGGDCRAACDDVVCPLGQSCRQGRCVEPCEGVACPEGRVCSGGACISTCDCLGCAVGEVCADSGLCVEMACDGVDCAVGERCEAGACVDRCAGAVCPVGSRCAQGVCELVELTEEEIAALAEDAMTPDVGEGGDDEATPGVAPDAGAAGAGQDDSAGAGKGESPSGAPIRVSVDSRSDETASCGLGAAGSTRTGQGLLWLLPLLALGRLWRAWRASAGPRVGRGRAGSAG